MAVVMVLMHTLFMSFCCVLGSIWILGARPESQFHHLCCPVPGFVGVEKKKDRYSSSGIMAAD